MILSENEIRNRLNKGDLRIDPILNQDSQIGTHSIDLRLGTEFSEYSNPQITPRIDLAMTSEIPSPRVFSISIGDNISLHPRLSFLVATMEHLSLPHDLIGLVIQRSAWSRLGLSIPYISVHPGFRGKLTFPLHNLGMFPLQIYPGMRIVQLLLAETQPDSIDNTIKPQPEPVSQQSIEMNTLIEIQQLKEQLLTNAERIRISDLRQSDIRLLLKEALSTQGPSRGKLLEKLARYILETIQGLTLIQQNARLKAEEIDLYLQNDIQHGFWRFAGSPIIVECKNWSNKVGAPEIGLLYEKLRSIGPDAKTAILISPAGFSRDALTKIREKRQQGIYILPLELSGLEEIADGAPAEFVLDRSYTRVLLL